MFFSLNHRSSNTYFQDEGGKNGFGDKIKR
jgi:hypothetical protein